MRPHAINIFRGEIIKCKGDYDDETMSDDESTLSTISLESDSEGDVIMSAIKQIVSIANTPMSAKNALDLLQAELKKAFYGDEASDEGDNDNDSVLQYPPSDEASDADDDMTIEKELRVIPHRKSDIDKWRELLVYDWRCDTNDDDRKKSKIACGKSPFCEQGERI